MGLHRALADAEVGGDILAGVAGKDHVHDLPLSRSEPAMCPLAAASRQASDFARSRDCSRARSTLARRSPRWNGFSMKSKAPAFMACTAIGTSLLPVIMMAGNRWPVMLSAATIRGRSFRVGMHRPADMPSRPG